MPPKRALAISSIHLADNIGDDTTSGDELLDAQSSMPPSGAVLRELHAVLSQLDPTFGGLEKVRNNRREPRWVHARFVEIYIPKPPVVVAPSSP